MPKYIVLLGPDGCGKTSTAIALSNLEKSRKVRLIEFTFEILPSFRTILAFFRPKASFSSPSLLLHSGMVTPLPSWRANILAIWYGIDYILSNIVIWRSADSVIYISARSYYDFLFQRAYRNVFTPIVYFFINLGPKPDLSLVLYRDSKDIYAEKPELTEDEINTQYRLISHRLVSLQYAMRFDVKNSPLMNAHSIFSILNS